MRMRRAEREDVPTVVEVVRTACAPAVLEGFPLSGADETEAQVLRDMEHKEVYLLCRRVDGYAVATIRLHVPPGADYLYATRVAVRPEWQHRGLAGQLLAFAGSVAARRGLRAVRLDTPEHYTRLIRLYERYGFSPTTRVALPGRPYTSVVLERVLDVPAMVAYPAVMDVAGPLDAGTMA